MRTAWTAVCLAWENIVRGCSLVSITNLATGIVTDLITRAACRP